MRFLFLFLAFFLCGCADNRPPAPDVKTTTTPTVPSGYVSRKMLGKAWPLTVEEGVLTCHKVGSLSTGEPLRSVTFTAPNGTVYAMNGAADDPKSGTDITPIWAKTADKLARKDIGVLIDRGLSLPPQ